MERILNTVPEIDLANLLIDSSIDAMMAVDKDQQIIAWNNAAEQILRLPRKKAMGKKLCELIEGFGDDKDSLRAIENGLNGLKSYLPATPKYKHRTQVEHHFIPLKTNAEVKGVMILIHDVAHRIKAEEQLTQVNRELHIRLRQLQITSDDMKTFTSLVSHNIKEPIRLMYTSLEHLIKVEGQRVSDSGKASFRRMQATLNRISLMVDDLLNVAKIDVLHTPVQMVDVKDLLNALLENLNKKIKEANAVITFGDLCEVRAHSDQLVLLMYHLVDNAIKFNDSPTPHVHISCCKKDMRGTERELVSDEYYELTIKDNGIGIPENDQQRIFKLFEKLNTQGYKGSGVGLAIVHKIMEAHEGFIVVESKPGEGSTFHCYFPA